MSSHESAYGASRSITDAQKLAEMVCERVASFLNVALVPRFWQQSDWRQTFANQVKFANQLLKLYDFEAIAKALRAAPKVRSLGAGFFVEYVEREQGRLDMARVKASNSTETETTDANEAPRQSVRKTKSVKSKLKDL